MEAANDAGTFFSLKVPIDAEADIGQSWVDVH